MLDPHNMEMHIFSMTNNVIGHDKGLRKELINLVSKIREESTNVNGIKKRNFYIKEYRDKFNPCDGGYVNNSITLHRQLQTCAPSCYWA